MLDAFRERSLDGALVKRLILGTCAGLALVFGVGLSLARAAANTAHAPPAEPEEPIVPISLVETVDEQPEEAPQEPHADAEPDPTPRVAGPPPPAMPTVVPEHQRRAEAQETYGDGDAPTKFGDGAGGRGPALPARAPKSPPKTEPPPPKRAAPKLSPEDYDPPRCKPASIDAAAARAAGVEGTVLVKYTVLESGAVTQVAVVTGPAELHALALAAARKTVCEPARRKADGAAISISRRVPFRVRFSTR